MSAPVCIANAVADALGRRRRRAAADAAARVGAAASRVKPPPSSTWPRARSRRRSSLWREAATMRSRSPAGSASCPRSTCASSRPHGARRPQPRGARRIQAARAGIRIGATVRQARSRARPAQPIAAARGAPLRRPLRHAQPRHRRRLDRPRRRRGRAAALPGRARRQRRPRTGRADARARAGGLLRLALHDDARAGRAGRRDDPGRRKPRTGLGFEELALRHGDFALAMVAVVLPT